MADEMNLKDRLSTARSFMGLGNKCCLEEVNKAYRRLSKIYHPDKGGDHEDMARLNDAVNILRAHPDTFSQGEASSTSSTSSDIMSSSESNNTEGDDEDEYNCKECNHKARSAELLRKHINNHKDKGRFKCSQCNETFARNQNLLRHRLKHIQKERPFICEHCSRGFRQKQELIRHLRTHTGDKPYKCPHCVKTFSTRSNMMRHAAVH